MIIGCLAVVFWYETVPQRFPPHDLPRTASVSKTRVVPRGLGSQRMNRNPQQKSPWEFQKEGPGISWDLHMDLLLGPGDYLLIPLFSPGGLIWGLLRLSVKMLLDGLRDRRNHEKSWVQRKGQQMTLKSGRL